MASTTLAQPTPAVRNFKITDAAMLAFSKTFLLMFIEDIAGFIALNPDFDGTFADDWQDAIDTAEATPSDEVVLDIQVQKTNEVLDAMKEARRKYNQVIYFAGEAFADNIAIQNEFGKDDYDSIRNKQDQMVTFLDNLHSTAVKYATPLLAKGFTATMATEITTLKEALSTANAAQQKLIKERPTATSDRIIKYNIVYGFCQKVNRASKQVFVDDYASIQEYLLPASENAAADIAFTGTVTRQEDSTIIEDATVTITELSLTATTDGFGVFAFAQEIPEGTYNFIITATGRVGYSGTVTLTDGETITRNVAMVAAVMS